MDIDHSSSVIFDDMEKTDFSVGPHWGILA